MSKNILEVHVEDESRCFKIDSVAEMSASVVEESELIVWNKV